MTAGNGTTASDHKVASAFLAESGRQLRDDLGKIKHCVNQLNDTQIWWRPVEGMNSIGNLLLHLRGNVIQRIQSFVGGIPDLRDRPREFSERTESPKGDLIQGLEEAVQEAGRVLSDFDPARLLEVRRYKAMGRDMEETLVGVIVRTVGHFGGHTQEIISFTRIQLGDAYQFTNPADQVRPKA